VTLEEGPTDVDEVKSSLRRLAGPDHDRVIERAARALDDLEAAAAFVEEVGLRELEVTIEATDDPNLEARGRRALERFRQFRRAAAGERSTDRRTTFGAGSNDHFHPGRGTDLRADPEGPTR
jgi:hypothetical protein